jgi:protein tyrosine phosphatase
MNWIQNISAVDCQKGNHFDCGVNSMLIQIADTKTHHSTPWFPEPKHKFKSVHRFEFLDTDSDVGGITKEQAVELVMLLHEAFDNRMNVIVHCTAGICRSGAVVEVGIMMGFTDTETYRLPNTRVKTMMMYALGWSYESDVVDLTDSHSVIQLMSGA